MAQPTRLSQTLALPSSFVTDPDYYTLLETHIPYIRSISSPVQVLPNTADIYQGDFDGLLENMGIPKKYHYLVRRINGYNNSGDYDGQETTILIPGGERFLASAIEQIIVRFLSKTET